MWDLNIKFCPKFRLICIAQNYAHLCKYIIFKNNNFFFKVHVFCYHYNKTQTARNQFDEIKYYTVIVLFLNCYLRNYDHIAEYLLVAIIISLYFQKTDISFTYLVCTCAYLCRSTAIYHQECMYIFVIMLKVLWNVHLINCISQKMFHSFSVFFNFNTCTSLYM